MNITRSAIEKNRITIVTLIIILFAGIMTYKNMPRSEDPGFIVRVATVTTYFPGASPDRVEQLVTDKLEKAIQEMPELDAIRSQSSTGFSIIYVEIKQNYRDMKPIWDKLRRKVEKVNRDLPESVIGPRVNDEFGDVFGIIITITGEGFSYADLKEVADEVRDEMLLFEDVAKVDIYGAQEERIFVEYNNGRLADLGLSPLQLRNIMEQQNIIIPGGDITTDFEKIIVEPSGNFETVGDLRRTIITLPGRNDLVYLEDIADIYRGYIDPPQNKMLVSGEPCLGLAISMREDGNIINFGRKIKTLVETLQTIYPIGIEFNFIQFQPEEVQKRITQFTSSLVQAVAVVAGIMLFALGIRTGLVVASLIPMAMLMSLVFMGFFDISLDQMSLASLIIALGMLVDNAIVMSESIMVQMAEGKAKIEAAIDSARELRIPLLTSSLTTAAAFLPIVLAESDTGEYTAPLFKVVTITLLCSWLLSLTMVPLFCVKFIKVQPDPEKRSFDSKFYVGYRAFLQMILKHRWLSLIVTIVIFTLVMSCFSYIPVTFFPTSDRATFTAELELPGESPIERTEGVVEKMDRFIRENLVVGPERLEGVTNWVSFIGSVAPRFILPYAPEETNPGYVYVWFNTTSFKIFEKLIPALEEFCNDQFPDLKATIRPLDLGPPAWPPIEIRISGRDPVILFEIVGKVKTKLRQIPGTRLIDDDWGERSKKLLVKVDGARARRSGVSNQDVAISLQTFLSGLETTKFREEDKLIPVTLRSVGGGKADIIKLRTLNVFSQTTGRSVPLEQVADIEVQWQPSKIKRRNRLKTVTVEAGTNPGVTANEVIKALKPWLSEESKNWGLGYSWTFGGQTEASSEANAAIAAKLPIAGLIIILLLVGQFNSIRRPLIILITIPLGLIGVVIGLLLADSYFGFMTLLGVVSLSGIVINNAIVLLDRIRIEIEENGLDPKRAVIESAQRRLRPILLTTCTTVGGLLPLWFGGGPMWEPMAITIIFGLIFATCLTLGVVPVLYATLFKLQFKDFEY
ncbi:MAG: efflux RND transporter permease subunit [Deltaproteobacteria bacterium]|nr:efflux RND transporter permease subunit [Deltaproteobacteria bacterium]